jgi:hypothetical protein
VGSGLDQKDVALSTPSLILLANIMNKEEKKAAMKAQKALAQTLKLVRSLHFLLPELNPETRSILADGFNPVGGIDAVANVVDSLEWKMWSLLQKEKGL